VVWWYKAIPFAHLICPGEEFPALTAYYFGSGLDSFVTLLERAVKPGKRERLMIVR